MDIKIQIRLIEFEQRSNLHQLSHQLALRSYGPCPNCQLAIIGAIKTTT